MKQISDTPRMNSACRQMLKNLLLVAQHNNDNHVAHLLTMILDKVQPLETESPSLTQEQVDELIRGAK